MQSRCSIATGRFVLAAARTRLPFATKGCPPAASTSCNTKVSLFPASYLNRLFLQPGHSSHHFRQASSLSSFSVSSLESRKRRRFATTAKSSPSDSGAVASKTQKQQPEEEEPTTEEMIRLTKRMGQLDMFSRREADRLILDGRVLVDGTLVEVGHKVSSDLPADRIEVLDRNPPSSHPAGSGDKSRGSQNNETNDSGVQKGSSAVNKVTAVVLNKPRGYVSGQAEHGHPPAIRLLTPRNRLWEEEETEDRGPRRRDNNDHWRGFAPAGRLDLDSTGLLVFTKNGVLAKKLIGASSSVEKEYIVDVVPAVKPTRRELAIDPSFFLPSRQHQQKFDLTQISRGGGFLLGDDRPLKPCPRVRWITEGEKLQIALTEGRKHHVRRMCRELLGFHVVGLRRIRIGPIVLPTNDADTDRGNPFDRDSHSAELPEGCWRPLRQWELEKLLRSSFRQ